MPAPSSSKLRPVAARTIRRGQIPWGIVLAVCSVISLIALVYYWTYRKSFQGERDRILKERKALADDIAHDFGQLRNDVEGWAVADATKPFPGDALDPDGRKAYWRERPAIYLRLRVADAQTADAVHANAKLSSLDGLSACLLQTKGSFGPWAYGDVVSRAEMLGSDFTNEVRETSNDLRVRNLAFALDHYKESDYPFARDAIRMSEYVVLALDEDPASIPATSAAFGSNATISERIAPVAHPIRLYVYRLSDHKELLRIRRNADAELVQLQGDPTAPGAGIEIARAKALGCAMADAALEYAGITAPSTTMDETAAPLPRPAPTASASASSSASPSPSTSTLPSSSAPK